MNELPTKRRIMEICINQPGCTDDQLRLIIPHSGKHESAGRKTSIRGAENADSHKERSNSPKERTLCKI